MDVLSTFGELDEDMSEKRKYAKWKAAYIHNCLKVGERPTPGSFGGKQADFTPIENDQDDQPYIPYQPPSNGTIQPTITPPPVDPNFGFGGMNNPNTMGTYVPPVLPSVPTISQPTLPQPTLPQPMLQPVVTPTPISSSSSTQLSPEQMQKAQKYCKWATSALNYDDVNTAILNLQKALTLLQTGSDPAD